MSTSNISAIKSQVQQMVSRRTAPTFQEALLLWQIENRQLSSDELDVVMGVDDPLEQAAAEMESLFDRADAIMAKPIYQD